MNTKATTAKKTAAKKAVAKKPVAKPVAAKPVVAPVAAPPATEIKSEMKLKFTGPKPTLRGKRAELIALAKNGMTVAKLQQLAVDHFGGNKDWNRRAKQVIGATVAKGSMTLVA